MTQGSLDSHEARRVTLIVGVILMAVSLAGAVFLPFVALKEIPKLRLFLLSSTLQSEVRNGNFEGVSSPLLELSREWESFAGEDTLRPLIRTIQVIAEGLVTLKTNRDEQGVLKLRDLPASPAVQALLADGQSLLEDTRLRADQELADSEKLPSLEREKSQLEDEERQWKDEYARIFGVDISVLLGDSDNGYTAGILAGLPIIRGLDDGITDLVLLRDKLIQAGGTPGSPILVDPPEIALQRIASMRENLRAVRRRSLEVGEQIQSTVGRIQTATQLRAGSRRAAGEKFQVALQQCISELRSTLPPSREWVQQLHFWLQEKK
jgi:hypothetical protein